MLGLQGISHLRLSNVSCAYALRMPRRPSVSEFSGSMLTMHKQSSHTLQMTADVPVDSKPKPWLLVGLGNPGKLYNGTRHNVGFEMIDTIAQAEGISVSRIQCRALFGKGHINGNPVMLAKPQTFMNASGESVGPLVAYYKIPLNQVLLDFNSPEKANYSLMEEINNLQKEGTAILMIFDDMDLPFAKLRLLPKGGHGGHNGMKSVIDHFKGNREFPRLRIGIGRPPGKMNPISYVLQPFTKGEQEELDLTLQDGLDAIRILINQGFDKSASIVNRAQKARIQNS